MDRIDYEVYVGGGHLVEALLFDFFFDQIHGLVHGDIVEGHPQNCHRSAIPIRHYAHSVVYSAMVAKKSGLFNPRSFASVSPVETGGISRSVLLDYLEAGLVDCG